MSLKEIANRFMRSLDDLSYELNDTNFKDRLLDANDLIRKYVDEVNNFAPTSYVAVPIAFPFVDASSGSMLRLVVGWRIAATPYEDTPGHFTRRTVSMTVPSQMGFFSHNLCFDEYEDAAAFCRAMSPERLSDAPQASSVPHAQSDS